MVTLIANPAHFAKSRLPFSYLSLQSVPSPILHLNFKKGFRATLVLPRKDRFLQLNQGNIEGASCSWCCWCSHSSESEGDAQLEAKILEFMEQSPKSDVFPSRKELEGAGRADLVEAIRKRGGWFSLGWDSENEVQDADILKMDFDIDDFQTRVESFHIRQNGVSCSVSESSGSVPNSPSSSGPSLREGRENPSTTTKSDFLREGDSGIEGILSRLEKERNLSFGIDLGKYYHHNLSSSENDSACVDSGTAADAYRSNFEENSKLTSDSSNNGRLNGPPGNLNQHSSPDAWRTWSLHRAGFQDTEFEAAEIIFDRDHIDIRETSGDEIFVREEDSVENLHKWKEINPHQIQTRLQQLERELFTTLHSIRLKNEEFNSKLVLKTSSSDLHDLSDAWEFQENEVMYAQERLRSIRAKMAVLEGKMALAITNAQKLMEDKKKRIDGARKALYCLRMACIVWPNPASEVLLAGSFDGWTTQRKMEKSRTGIFSVYLKLYPGQYEIKFIVDGIWRTDPLRPIVHNNGYENNLLIIT